MKKTTHFLVAITLFVAFLGIAAISQEEFGPETASIDDTTRATMRYLPVMFKHEMHVMDFDITCLECHHTEKEDFTSGTPTACDMCHLATGSGEELSYKNSMHQQCVMCHIEETALGMNPPVECSGCHIERDL